MSPAPPSFTLAPVLALALAACTAPDCAPGTTPGIVTTLFFGLSRQNQPDVPEAAWRDFLERDLLGQLPGATVVEGLGAVREPGKAPVTERSRVVTIGHRGNPEQRQALAEAIGRYRSRFDQWGVGRADVGACTNFD
ncbi:MAG: DUF3574 domain-containing protein [Rhodospirillaceae bacterium]